MTPPFLWDPFLILFLHWATLVSSQVFLGLHIHPIPSLYLPQAGVPPPLWRRTALVVGGGGEGVSEGQQGWLLEETFFPHLVFQSQGSI